MTLSEFILSDTESILAEWEKYATTIHSAANMDTAALRDHAEAILRNIAHDIAQPQTAAQQEAKSKGEGPDHAGDTAAQAHAVGRQLEGFSLTEMVSEYRALRASVIRLWIRKVPSADHRMLDQMTRFNEGIDQALSESIERYSNEIDRSRELFLGVLGHDLRSPLGAMLHAAQYLLGAGKLSGGHAEAASIITRSGTHLQGMISDLLDVTRTRLGQSLPITLAETNAAAVCKEAVDDARAYHPDHAVTFHSAGDVHGSWDAARLRQMLSNLIENAIRYGSAGTPVTVSAIGDADRVVLAVHNEGNPIPEAERGTIFEPLAQGERSAAERKKAGGIGLGLYIARAIAQAHGGSIGVESSQERGTIFAATLPRNRGQHS